jgi:hypothetical protein
MVQRQGYRTVTAKVGFRLPLGPHERFMIRIPLLLGEKCYYSSNYNKY